MKISSINARNATRVLKNLDWKIAGASRAVGKLSAASKAVKKLVQELEGELEARDELILHLRKENEILRADRKLAPEVPVQRYSFKKIDASPLDILKMDAEEILPLPDGMNDAETAIRSRIIGSLRWRPAEDRTVQNLMRFEIRGIGKKGYDLLHESFRHFKLESGEVRRALRS